jgi:hypothetical protein
MTRKVNSVWQVLLLAVWINLSESVRWILYSKPQIDARFQSIGLTLPNNAISGILWMIWGGIIAFMIFIVSQKFTLVQTALFIWVGVFVMHWILLWNYAMLPLGILPVAVPLSLIEIFIAALIAKKLQPHASPLVPSPVS